ADSVDTGRTLPTRPSASRAFVDASRPGGLPRRIPPAKAGPPAPVGEGAPGKAAALGNGNGEGHAPADRRAVQPPGQPPLPPRRSRPAARDDAPSPWFASAAAETAPAAEETAESRKPAD
ncbi:hypothetical protein KN815_49765, partial [Streptomyces sp. 4503]|nr:hypothetical protein [Streptomyces niphimycinicus]